MHYGGEHRIPREELAAAFDPRFRPRIDPETGRVVRIGVATDGRDGAAPRQVAAGVGADPFAPPAGKDWEAAQKVLRAAVNRENISGKPAASRMLAFEAVRQRYTAILNSGDPKRLTALADAHGLLFYEMTAMMGYKPELMRLILGIARNRVADGRGGSVESRKAAFARLKHDIWRVTSPQLQNLNVGSGRDHTHPRKVSAFISGPITELNNAYHGGMTDFRFGGLLKNAIYFAGERGRAEASAMEAAGPMGGVRNAARAWEDFRTGRKLVLREFRGTTSAVTYTTRAFQPKPLVFNQSGVVTGGDSKALGINLMKEMELPPGTSVRHWPGYEAHHIIPKQFHEHPAVIKAGLALDDSTNGIFLPQKLKPINVSPKHRGRHREYSRAVKERLDNIDPNASVAETRRQLNEIRDQLKLGIERGTPLYDKLGGNIELWRVVLK